MDWGGRVVALDVESSCRRLASKAHVKRSAVSAARRLTGTRGVRRLMQVTPGHNRPSSPPEGAPAGATAPTIIPTRGSRRSGDRSNHAATAPTVIPTKGSRRSGDRSNHAATAPKRPTAPPFRCAVGPLCFDCSASRRNNLPLFPRVRRCAGPPEIPPRGVPRSGLVSGRFPFRRSLATRSSDASPSLFTSARLQVPQPEGLRTRACP